MVRRILDEHGHKLIRYAGVSVIGVSTGQLLLFVFYELGGWNAVLANTVAVALGTIPSYVLNRAWVWKKDSPHSLTREILPFWGITLLGLLLSTGFAWYADRTFSSPFAVNLANAFGFGVVWVFKYLLLDRLMFGAHRQGPVEAEPVRA